jgi:hypothetical protein
MNKIYTDLLLSNIFKRENYQKKMHRPFTP